MRRSKNKCKKALKGELKNTPSSPLCIKFCIKEKKSVGQRASPLFYPVLHCFWCVLQCTRWPWGKPNAGPVWARGGGVLSVIIVRSKRAWAKYPKGQFGQTSPQFLLKKVQNAPFGSGPPKGHPGPSGGGGGVLSAIIAGWNWLWAKYPMGQISGPAL